MSYNHHQQKNYHRNSQYQNNLGFHGFKNGEIGSIHGQNGGNLDRLTSNDGQQNFKLPWSNHYPQSNGHPDPRYPGSPGLSGLFYPQKNQNGPRVPFMSPPSVPPNLQNGVSPYGSPAWNPNFQQNYQSAPSIPYANHHVLNQNHRQHFDPQNIPNHQANPRHRSNQRPAPAKKIEVKQPPPSFDADGQIWPELIQNPNQKKLIAPYSGAKAPEEQLIADVKSTDDSDSKTGEKMAWSHLLQKPGMALFNGHNAANSNLRSNKAERKNTNMEPKAWLYAWLGFRHIRPTYAWQTIGERPVQNFKCILSAEGFKEKGTGMAQSKKEAQSKAAWNFIDWLLGSKLLLPNELEHVKNMKQKALGVQDPVRAKKEEKKPDEEILIKEMEEMMKSDVVENSSALPQPAWIRGEQNLNNVDEFWRRKDQISGNSMGDPAPTGGTGTDTDSKEQEDGAAGTPLRSSQPQASLPSTPATSPSQDNQNQSGTRRETPRKLAAHGNSSTSGRTHSRNTTSPTTATATALSSPSPQSTPRNSSSNNEASSKNHWATHHTRSNPPPVIHSVYIPAAAAPTVPGAQPGSPFFPISAEHNSPQVIPPHYNHPPPSFLPPPSPGAQPLYSVPPPALPFIPPPPAPPVDNETAKSLRGMLEDITAELTVENTLGANLPCRNGVLEKTDIILLKHCNRVSLPVEKQDILEKVTRLVEKSMKNLSDALVRQAAADAGRQDLVDLLDDARNNNGMKILQRKKSEPTEAEIKQKKDLNELRQVTNLFRVGALPMKNLLLDNMESEMVLFFKSPPSQSLKKQVLKTLPSCIDKTFNLGVEEGDASVLISGEILNEFVKCRLHFTCKDITATISDDPLPADLTSSSLQQVRRANFWRNEALEAYSIMDRVCRLMIHLRSQENHILQRLSVWQMQLIIYYSVNITPSSFNSTKLGIVDAFRRIFEFMSTGILTHHKLRDPVDPANENIFSTVGQQDKEDLAEWAAQSLKHIAFDQLEEIFPIVFDDEGDVESDGEEDRDSENEETQKENKDENEAPSETVQKDSAEKSPTSLSEIDELLAKTSINP